MTPTDIRNATFERLRGTLHGRLHEVYETWLEHGPGTTRAVALRSGRDLLALRPRTTELYQLGLVELIGRDPKDGGIYRARTQQEWNIWHATAFDQVNSQLQFL